MLPLIAFVISVASCSAQTLSDIHHEKTPATCVTRTAEDFVPMTRSERLAYIIKSSVGSPTPFAFTAIRSGIDQAYDRPEEWGRGADGYARRYGSVYAEYFIDQAFEQSFAYKFHEDNRYFGSGDRNVVRRFGYAVASAVLARHDNRSRSVSASVIAGAAAAAFISRTWQPRSTTTAGDAAISFGLTIGTRMGMNVLREFSPRLFGRLLP